MPEVELPFNQSNGSFLKLITGLVVCSVVMSLLHGCASESKVDVGNLYSSDIMDEENLFDEEAEKGLLIFLDSLEQETGIDFVLATVSDPGSEGLIGYAASMTRKISPGSAGINNGAIIYLSDYHREVKVECGYGMEWYVSDTASGFIIERMRPFLVDGDYANAARTGFLEVAKLAAGQDWNTDITDWEAGDTARLTPGMILTLTGKGIARAYQEGVPEATQFHPNYFIDVVHKEKVSKIYFSGYMRDIVDRIVYSDRPVVLHSLVISTQPLRLGLIGTNESPQ